LSYHSDDKIKIRITPPQAIHKVKCSLLFSLRVKGVLDIDYDVVKQQVLLEQQENLQDYKGDSFIVEMDLAEASTVITEAARKD